MSEVKAEGAVGKKAAAGQERKVSESFKRQALVQDPSVVLSDGTIVKLANPDALSDGSGSAAEPARPAESPTDPLQPLQNLQDIEPAANGPGRTNPSGGDLYEFGTSYRQFRDPTEFNRPNPLLTIQQESAFTNRGLGLESPVDNRPLLAPFQLTDLDPTQPQQGLAPYAGLTSRLTDIPRSDTTASAPRFSVTGISTDTGANATDGVTNDQTLRINGAGATPLQIVTVFDNGASIGTTTASTDGSWAFDFTATALPDGTHTFSAQQSDNNGNTAISDTFAVTIDTAIAAPAAVGLTDNVGGQTGPLANGAISDDATPTLAGTGEAGAVVIVRDGATTLGLALVGANGSWSFTPAALAQGVHTFTTVEIDLAGNTSTPSAALTVTIDTTAAAPAFTVSDNAGAVTGTVGTGASSDDNTPTLAGTAEANAVVTIRDGAASIGTATANAQGNWTFTAGTLTDGAHTLSATQVDVAGNTSAPQNFVLTIDTTAAAPAQVDLAAASDNGSSNSDNVTSITQPILRGAAGSVENGAVVTIFDGATSIGTTTAGTNGAWSFTPGIALSLGTHTITATQVDQVGNSSAASAALTVTVVNGPPAPATADLIAASDSGTSSTDNLTNDTTPTLQGAAGAVLANAVITVFDGGTSIGTATAAADGSWSFTPAATLSQGAHTFTLSQTDATGFSSAPSAPLTVTIDTTAAAPAFTVSDNAGTVTGTVGTGASSDDNTPTLAGTAEANAVVTIRDGAASIGTATANAQGNWTFTTGTLTDGAHTLSATQVDVAGNTSAPQNFVLTIDTQIPAPTIGAISNDTGRSASDGITNDNTLILNGTAAANATVTIFADGISAGSILADGQGHWTFDFTGTSLADGQHTFSAQQISGGFTSATSGNFNVVVDTTVGAPTASAQDNVGAITGTIPTLGTGRTDDNTPTLVGTAEANAVVTIRDGATSIGTATADAQGNWTFTTGALADGTHNLSATQTDLAGNTGLGISVGNLVIDTVATAPVFTVNDNFGATTGNLNSGDTTDDNTPTLSGTVEARSVVTIRDGATSIGTVTADAQGGWSFTTGTLAVGAHTLSAQQVDSVGNTSAVSGNFTVTIDPPAGGPPVPAQTPTPTIADALRLTGEASHDHAGRWVSGIGDVNNDGFDDYAVGGQNGSSYIIFGSSALGAPIQASLAGLASGAIPGFRLTGLQTTDGAVVSGAGDINGDGIADFIIGTPYGANGDGGAVVVFGGQANFATLNTLSVGQIGTTLGGLHFTIAPGDAPGFTGMSVASAGDINGDGIDDLVIGARLADQEMGRTYVVFGGTTLTGTIDLGTVGASTAGFQIVGESSVDQAGWSVSSAGDINGDGISDLLVGAVGGPNGTFDGSTYVVFGGQTNLTGTLSLHNITGLGGNNSLRGFRLDGPLSSGAHAGYSVSSAGDVNGDGIDDIIVGANLGNIVPGGGASGEAFVIFGRAGGTGLTGALSLGNVGTGISGFHLVGDTQAELIGSSVSSAGDVNGDGIDDLLIGAYDTNAQAGRVYVLFGQTGGLTGTIHLPNIGTSVAGFQLDGLPGSRLGVSVSSAGDVNGDGFDDLFVGAHYASNGTLADNGSAYIVFGGNFSRALTQDATATNHTLTGTTGIDVLNGSSLADQLIGNGGADVLRGGAGDDVLSISDATFQRLDGGNGFDTLRLASGNLDLTHVANNRLSSIEQIDLVAGSGNNILTLDQTDLFDLSETQAHAGTLNSIRILGGATDEVRLNTAPATQGNWIANGTFNGFGDGLTYNVWEFQQNGAAHGTLYVQQGVTAGPSFDVGGLSGSAGIAGASSASQTMLGEGGQAGVAAVPFTNPLPLDQHNPL